MNLKEIKELIVLMNENSLDELEIEKEGLRVRLKRKADGIESVIVQAQPKSAEALSQSAAAQAYEKAQKEELKKNLIEIKAPMVGTFYRAAAPEAPPFIEIAQKVNKGDIVCIIEAMKLMNEIKSEISGKIVEILVENGRPVEFGQVIFLVEPNE